MISGQSFYTYTLGKSDFAIDSLTDEQTNLHLGFINFRYTQADQVINNKFVRPTLASFLWIIGGFLSLITRMTNFTLAGYQSFTIDKSLIKKIFSWKETQRAKDHSFFEKGNSEDGFGYNYDKKQRQLKETIMTRHVFRYNWTQRLWADFKKRVKCICCCGLVSTRRCCCCQRKGGKGHHGRVSAAKKEDRLYAEGLRKLYLEIDLLEVVK